MTFLGNFVYLNPKMVETSSDVEPNGERITETSEPRVTENGDIRVIE